MAPPSPATSGTVAGAWSGPDVRESRLGRGRRLRRRPTTRGCSGRARSSSPANHQRGIREETLLWVPGAVVHLMAGGSEGPLELARGNLSIVRIFKDDVAVTTMVRVGRDLGWPLARDEPVVKLNRLHYLFTLPDKDGALLNDDVSFADAVLLQSLDALLKPNSSSTAFGPSKSSRLPPPASASSDAAATARRRRTRRQLSCHRRHGRSTTSARRRSTRNQTTTPWPLARLQT